MATSKPELPATEPTYDPQFVDDFFLLVASLQYFFSDLTLPQSPFSGRQMPLQPQDPKRSWKVGPVLPNLTASKWIHTTTHARWCVR